MEGGGREERNIKERLSDMRRKEWDEKGRVPQWSWERGELVIRLNNEHWREKMVKVGVARRKDYTWAIKESASGRVKRCQKYKMEDRECQGLSLLPLQDVVISLILPLLSPRDWCALRAVDTNHLQIVTDFIAANRRLELPYCKQLTEPGLSLLTQGSTCLQSLTLSGRLSLGRLTP